MNAERSWATKRMARPVKKSESSLLLAFAFVLPYVVYISILEYE